MESQETYGSPTEFHGPESLPKCQKSSSRSLHQARDNVEPTSSIQWSAQKNLAEDRKRIGQLGDGKCRQNKSEKSSPRKKILRKNQDTYKRRRNLKRKKKPELCIPWDYLPFHMAASDVSSDPNYDLFHAEANVESLYSARSSANNDDCNYHYAEEGMMLSRK